MSVNTSVRCRHCGTQTTEDLLESHVAERCPRLRPTRPRDDMAALRGSGLPRTVSAMHDRQRHNEVPQPWSIRLAERRAASGEPAAVPQVLRDSDGVPKPWSSALAARNRSEVR